MPAKKYAETGLYLGQKYPEFFPLEINQGPLTDIDKLTRHPNQVLPYLYHSFLFMKEQEMEFSKLVYGHTHAPCFEQIKQFGDFDDGSTRVPQEWKEQKFTIYNTGGWVNISNTDTIDPDNATAKAPNPMFLYRDGRIEKALR
ncbi:MAG: hypothetical protein U5Q03_14550 [Bacteroidota bacterium]|nr:hypothetical protein [Bacteroidota bacterium]